MNNEKKSGGPETDSRIIVIGGRSFEPAKELTFRHHLWLMKRIEAARLHEPAVDPSEFISRAFADEQTGMELLAGSLVQVGTEWSPEIAMQVAEFFGELTDPADHATLQNVIVGLIARFFLSAKNSAVSSPSSSPKPARNKGSTSRRGAIAPARNSVSGRSSSTTSPTGTSIESSES